MSKRGVRVRIRAKEASYTEKGSDMVVGAFFKMQVVKKPYVFNLLRFICPSACGIHRAPSARDQLMYLKVVVLLRLNQLQLFV